MTRAEAKESFNHVLDKVVDRGDSSSLKIALLEDGITDICDFLDEVIDSLAYKDPDDKIFYPLKKGDNRQPICLRLHPNLRTIHQLQCSVAPSRKTLHSFRL
jgi:hypothetical protein